MNNLLQGLKDKDNITCTENGALVYKTTKSDLFDMFSFGGAYRSRSEEEVTLLFKQAYEENPEYALKCLFYLRAVRGLGQGERRFFRVAYRWLAIYYPEVAIRNMKFIALFGRWDDYYCLADTPIEKEMFAYLKAQLQFDLLCKYPSLLAKWLKSANCSSEESRRLARKTYEAFNMSPSEYRKVLSTLREKIRVLERLMSEQRYDEIEFDKVPSKAGLVYHHAFVRNDALKLRYERFLMNKNTKLNAGTLFPYEIVEKVINESTSFGRFFGTESTRLALNKCWDNLTDYFNGNCLNALAVVDTSNSMLGTALNAAISLGLYCAERAGGPFANHYISFSSRPQLIELSGFNFVDKVESIYSKTINDNTNIEKVFDLLLNTAIDNHCTQNDMPKNIIIISDMEFNQGTGWMPSGTSILMESIARKWARHGYELPHLIYWNVYARHNIIPQLKEGRVSFVSGFSPSIFQSIVAGKTGYELMMKTLNNYVFEEIK